MNLKRQFDIAACLLHGGEESQVIALYLEGYKSITDLSEEQRKNMFWTLYERDAEGFATAIDDTKTYEEARMLLEDIASEVEGSVLTAHPPSFDNSTIFKFDLDVAPATV